MRFNNREKINSTKDSAQSMIMDLAQLRFDIHERVFFDEEYAESEDESTDRGKISITEKYNVRSPRQLLKTCVDLFKDFVESKYPITSNPENIALYNEKPWLRMVRYAICDDTSYDGRKNFWYIIDYAIQVYMDYLTKIREEQKDDNE